MSQESISQQNVSPNKALGIRLPLSEIEILEAHCQLHSRTKTEVLREFIRSLDPKLPSAIESNPSLVSRLYLNNSSKSGKDRAISIRLSQDMLEGLDARATRDEKDRTQIIREAIAYYLMTTSQVRQQ